MRTLRRQGYTSEQYPIDEFGHIFRELNQHMRDARDLAVEDMTNYQDILIRQVEAMEQKDRVQRGELPEDVQAILDN